jgi:hypothetical protein
VVSAVIRGIDLDHVHRPSVLNSIKQQQLDTRRAAREDAEIDAPETTVAPRGWLWPVCSWRLVFANLSFSMKMFSTTLMHHPPAQQFLRNQNHAVRLKAKSLLERLERS